MDKEFGLNKSSKLWIIGAAILGIGVLGVGVAYTFQMGQIASDAETETAQESSPQVKAVTALGRIEPLGEIVEVAPPASATGAKVSRLLVQEGDRIEANQIIAVLDDFDRRQLAVERAKRDVEVAQANLDVVQAGAKQGDIRAASSEVDRLQVRKEGEKETQEAGLKRLLAERRDAIANFRNAQADRYNAQVDRRNAQLEQYNAQADLRSAEAELRNAATEYQRYRLLYEQGAISAAEFDDRGVILENAHSRLATARSNIAQTQGNINKAEAQIAKTQGNIDKAEAQIAQVNAQIDEAEATLRLTDSTLAEQINIAQGNLSSVAEVRPVNVRQAETEVKRAATAFAQAQADLELGVVRSPISGEVLSINVQAGESLSQLEGAGIAEIGRTDQMVVVAEVYESDISNVRVNQEAKITSESAAFSGELTGTVQKIGKKIGKKEVLDTDPAADVDVRVVEVDILLPPEDSKKVAALTNSKVFVEILL